MRKLVIIDDDLDILNVLNNYMGMIGIKNLGCFSSWDLAEAFIGPNDVVLSDINGVGTRPAGLTAKVYTMSGDPRNKPDLNKPFGLDDIENILAKEGLLSPERYATVK